MLRRSLPFFFVLAPTIAFAQTPITIPSGAQIQIPIPPNADKPRLQVLLAGSNTVLDDERANVQNGVAVARLEADPGLYDVRLVSNDKARTPLGALSRFQIPGFKREAGRWLFNGSPVVVEGTNPAPTTSFVPNLRRDKKTKLPFSMATSGALKWRTAFVQFPVDTPLDEVATRQALRASPDANQNLLAVEVTPRQNTFPRDNRRRALSYSPSEVLVGVPLSEQEVQQTKSNWSRLRSIVDEVAPSAALILDVNQNRLLDSVALDQVIAPLADAVEVQVNGAVKAPMRDEVVSRIPFSANVVKVARRNVEESPNFDLPVFASFISEPGASDILQAFQAGASNIIVPDGTSNPVLDVLTRQSARFSGAVTLEDVGMQARDFDRFAPILRRAGRVPLLARLPGDGNGEKKSDSKSAESLFVGFDSSTDQATLDKIERAAKVGATIYCEGTLSPALYPRWSEIIKTQIAPLAATKKSTLTLSEPWFWGTTNDQNFDVLQSVTLSVKPSLSAQTKDVKGEARETVARPIASFNDDPNGIMLCPVGKGRVIWAPFNVAPNFARSRQKVNVNLDDLDPALIIGVPNLSFSTAYYAAIAGAMQPSLVDYSATKGDAANISVALRALPADPENPKSSAVTLAAFFNAGSSPVDLNATVRGDGAYALDLMTDQTVPVKVRDFGSRMSLSVPANGFRWIAVAKDAQSWNDAGKNKVKARLR